MLIDPSGHPEVERRVMSLSAYSIQGKRNHMEDFFDVSFQMKPADQRKPNEWPYEFFYFAIFDGHGGSEAADFAKDNLRSFITQQEDFWSNDDQDVMRAISKGFSDTHAAMRRDMVNWSRTSAILPSTAGTTASILFIKNGKFYTGHVGDSRIVIGNENNESKQWISYQLTEDHKPESEQESKRIQRAGGEVKDKVGVPRVVWKKPVLNDDMTTKLDAVDFKEKEYKELLAQISSYPLSESVIESYHTVPFLAIARSLGDFWSLNPYSGQYIVSPEPDVSCRPIDPNDKSILLGTDGLWNVINSGQAIRYLQELSWRKSLDKSKYDGEYFSIDNFYDVAGDYSENHAMSLVYIAYQVWERRRLRADNISAVVVMLHDLAANCPPPSKSYKTRARTKYVKPLFDKFGVRVNAYKLGETVQIMSKIGLNFEPIFSRFALQTMDEKWNRFKDFLVLPPTVLEQEELTLKERRSITFPKNYVRLSWATCRKISVNDPSRDLDQDESNRDTHILIKMVSDDPADVIELPTRLSKSGKQVKDASAQATQCIHDFGQPWDQLMIGDDEPFDYSDYSDEELLKDRFPDDAHSPDDDELYFIDELYPDGAPQGLLDDTVKSDDDSNDDADKNDKVAANLGPSGDEDEEADGSRPQFRCLLNYTPPLRRSTRNSYQSVSDNVKRKELVDTSANEESSHKHKRRKSQPVRGKSSQK